jgi:hypothetical protein
MLGCFALRVEDGFLAFGSDVDLVLHGVLNKKEDEMVQLAKRLLFIALGMSVVLFYFYGSELKIVINIGEVSKSGFVRG